MTTGQSGRWSALTTSPRPSFSPGYSPSSQERCDIFLVVRSGEVGAQIPKPFPESPVVPRIPNLGPASAVQRFVIRDHGRFRGSATTGLLQLGSFSPERRTRR
jgi:hypothetical protein